MTARVQGYHPATPRSAFYADGAAGGAKPAAGCEKRKTKSAEHLDAAARRELLAIARRSIEETIRKGKTPEPATANQALTTPQGAFVTLTIGGELRGCIGTFREDQPLYRAVSQMAVSAAQQDPRFPQLSATELPKIHLEISALTPMAPVADVKDIEVGRHGLYVTRGFNSGVLLPQVATDYGWDRTTFLEQTCRKAGPPKDAWKQGAKILSFEAESLLMGGFDIAGGGVKEVVGREGEKPGIELDGGADAVKDDAGQIVVSDFLDYSFKKVKSPPMAAHKMLDGLGGEEFEVEHAAKREDHDEAIDSLGGDLTGISPIALSLLPWGGLNVEKGFGTGPQRSQIIAKDADASGVAQDSDLLVNPDSAHRGVMIQQFTDLP